jgi:hypothetical protein
MLLPTASRPVSWKKAPIWGLRLEFITVKHLRVCPCGALSLTRGRVCRLQELLVLASAVILGSESRGTCDHILLSQIRDSLFFASYDSQGYGGDIRLRLHVSLQTAQCFINWRKPNRDHRR